MDSIRSTDIGHNINTKIQERNNKLHFALDVGLVLGALLVVINVLADGVIFYGIHCAVFALNNIFLSSMFALSVPGLGMALCAFVIIVALIDMAGIIYLNLKQ